MVLLLSVCIYVHIFVIDLGAFFYLIMYLLGTYLGNYLIVYSHYISRSTPLLDVHNIC
jgi:hypothetical protein